MQSKRIKILLLNPPYKEPIIRDNYCCFTSKSGYLWPPVDLLYLSGNLKSDQTQIFVIDAPAERKTWDDVNDRTKIIKPDVVISLTGTVSFEKDLEGLGIARNFGGKNYVLGNTPSFKPEFFLRYGYIDGVLHNFFDDRILDFLLGKIPHCETISYKRNHTFRIGKINYQKPNSEIKVSHPPQYDLFPLERYATPIIRKKPMVTVLTSFGCPFNCKFCVASSLFYYRRRLEDLRQEFEQIKLHQIKEIFFEDSTFNANSQYMENICNILISNRYNFSWSANIHSFNMTEENLKLMKKAGCHTVQIGVESRSEEILKHYAPSKKIENIKQAFNLCRKVGLRTLGYFIIGFPLETPFLAEKTISFARELNPDFASFSILTPDYGTKLREEVEKNKLIDSKKIIQFDSSGEAVIDNPEFSKKLQEKYIRKAYLKFYLNPVRIVYYLKDYRNIILYLKNGINLVRKKLLE